MPWDSILATGVVAGLAGAAVVPALRRATFGTVRHDWLQNELALDRVEPDGRTIRDKSGGLTRAWALRGVSYDAKVEQEQHTLLLGRKDLIGTLGDKGGLALRLLAVKRRRPLQVAATWPCDTLTEIGRGEERRYTASHEVEWLLIASGQTMQALLDADQHIHARLAPYRPEAVTRPEDPAAPCPLTGLLNGLVCGEYRRDLPAVSASLSGSLPGADLQFDKTGVLRVQGADGPTWHRVIGIREWPATVSGRLIGELLALPGDLEIIQVCEPFGRDLALMLYKRQERAQKSNIFFPNLALIGETATVLDLLSEGTLTLFATQFQVIARASSEAGLETLVKAVREILGDRRIAYSVETVGAPVCWFNRLPAAPSRKALQPGTRLFRPLVLREENIAALWPLHHAATGLPTSPFGAQPVRLFQTLTGQAYSFQFHIQDKPQSRGNYLLFAPTGGGKSTLMLHLLGGLAKFDGVRSYIFDSKEGARFMVEALGGVYQGYDSLALNPLDVGPDTPGARNRVAMILRALCGDLVLTPENKEALGHAVDLAFQLAPPHRTLNEIFSHAFPRRSDLRRHMAQWVTDDKGNRGQHAHVFNAPHDSLGGILDHYMVGINMSEAQGDPDLGPPVVGHIAEAIGHSASRSTRGFVIFIDEAAKLLGNAGFSALAAEMFREYRKLNGAVGLAFQDPAALLRCPESAAFIENASTFIFLPNAQAKADSFKDFGLNDEHLAFVMGQTVTQGRRQALVIKRDAASGFDESAILDIDLGYLGDALRFYRAGTDANRHLETLKETWGESWRTHL